MEDIAKKGIGKEEQVAIKGAIDENPTIPQMRQTEEPFPFPMTVDSTSLTIFSRVDNTRYSQEIIAAARAAYDPERLAELKRGSNPEEFLAECIRQIMAQRHADQWLNAHSDMYRVLFQINVGDILNEVEPTFKKKKHYMKWVRDNFNVKHLRYLQQAKNLADMGDFAREHAAAGKNRLLALYVLMKVEEKAECLALFDEYPLPDMTDDEDGQVLKNHVDAVITLHRFHNADIGFVSFDHAAIIASLSKEAMTVQRVEQVKTWLNLQAEDERPALFDRYVQDQMTFPEDHPYTPAPRASLSKILSDLVNCCRTGGTEGDGWIERQRALVDMDTLVSAQRLIGELIERMGIEGSSIEPTA